MYYFGPYDGSGHHMYAEDGDYARGMDDSFPWDIRGHDIDGVLQPQAGVILARGAHPEEVEGEALLHHKAGWTALCFWDRSVDVRGGCSSNYFAQGEYTFDEMVTMANERFAQRWGKMKFTVKLAGTPVSA
jgi:hypothetical protein